jgi:hypothetical protein
MMVICGGKMMVGEDQEIEHPVEAEAIAREAMGRHGADDGEDQHRREHDCRRVEEIDVVVRVEPGEGELLEVCRDWQGEMILRDLGRGAQRHHRGPHERTGRKRGVEREREKERRALQDLHRQYSSLSRRKA